MLLHLILLPCVLLSKQSGLAIFEPDMKWRPDVINAGEVWRAEFWSPVPNERHCSVSIRDPIPRMAPMHQDTPYQLDSLDIWEDTLITCLHGVFCKKLTPSGWEFWRTSLMIRSHHSTAVTNEGLLLVGGSAHPTTTELLPWEGGKGPTSPDPVNPDPKYNRLGFTLKQMWSRHCSIQTSSNTIFLTGGEYGLRNVPVVEYSGLGAGEEVTSRELPPLIQQRMDHACGWYGVGDSKVLLVTGGSGNTGVSKLDTTEVLPLTGLGAGAWRQVGRLSSPRDNLRAAKIGDFLYVTGGIGKDINEIDEILNWNSVSESWTVVSHTKTAFNRCEVTVVPEEVVAKYCSANK